MVVEFDVWTPANKSTGPVLKMTIVQQMITKDLKIYSGIL
jgi:hypothetical protein